MTDEELQAIETRAIPSDEQVYEIAKRHGGDVLVEDAANCRVAAQIACLRAIKVALSDARRDVPALIAEVRRLRATTGVTIEFVGFGSIDGSYGPGTEQTNG